MLPSSVLRGMSSDGREELLQPTLGAGQGPSRGRKGPAGAGVVPGLGQRGRSCANTDAAAAPGGAEPAGRVHRLPRSSPPCAQVSPKGAGAGRGRTPHLPQTPRAGWMVLWPWWPPALRDAGALLCPEDGRSAISAGTTAHPPPRVPEVLLVASGAAVCWVGHPGHGWPSVSDIPGSAGHSTPSSQGCRAGDSGGASLGRLRPGQC